MIVTIHQPQYLPWLGYFDKADRADIFILLDDVQYKKNDWQSRNKIRTSQGWQWVTVPIISNFGQKIMDVKIDHKNNWNRSHLNAIKLNYSKAKFFKEYIEEIEEILSKEWECLVDLNIAFIRKIIMWLGVTTKIARSSDYPSEEKSTQRLIDLCLEFDADMYLSGIDGGKYLEFEKFKEKNVEVAMQDYSHPEYFQLWGGQGNPFLSHLSVLDLLFNHGSESLKILKNKNSRGFA